MAELTGCEGVLALLKQIYEVLQEYDQQTDAMINADLEVLQQSLLARNALIEKLEELKQQLESVIEVEQPEERVLLQTLVHGSYVNARWTTSIRRYSSCTEYHCYEAAYRR